MTIEENWMDLQAADGHRFKAWRAAPAAPSKGRVVVVQELFGVNPHMRSVTAACARAGYAAITPALFDRVERDVSPGLSHEAASLTADVIPAVFGGSRCSNQPSSV